MTRLALRLTLAFSLAPLCATPARAQASPAAAPAAADLLPVGPDTQATLARLRDLALGEPTPGAANRERLATGFRCSAAAPLPLVALDTDLKISAVRLDCEAEWRQARKAGTSGLAQFVESTRQLPGLLVVERLDYQALPDALRLRAVLLLPFAPAAGSVESEEVRRRAAAGRLGANSRWPFLILDALLSMSCQSVSREIQVQGAWRPSEDGKSYWLADAPSWTANSVGLWASCGIQRPSVVEYPWGGGRLALSKEGGLVRRTRGSCATVELKGTWVWCAPSDRPAPDADASPAPPRFADEKSFSVPNDLSALTDDELCAARRDAGHRRVLVASPAGSGPLTLRLRDVDLADVFAALQELTGQGFLVDPDVVGRAAVELAGVTLEQAIASIEAAARLSVSGPGSIRRVSTGQKARAWSFPTGNYTGHPVSLSLKREPFRKTLRLFAEIADLHVEAPAVSLDPVTLQVEEQPWDSVLGAILAVQGLASEVKGDVLYVRRGGGSTERIDGGARAGFTVFPMALEFPGLGFAGILANADPSTSRERRLVGFYLPTGALSIRPEWHFDDCTVKPVADDQIVVVPHPWAVDKPDEDPVRLSLPDVSWAGSASASVASLDGADPAAALYARAQDGGLGLPVDARSRLGLQRLLIRFLRDLGETETARRAVRDALAMAAALPLESDADLGRLAASMVELARALGVPSDQVSDRLVKRRDD